MGDTPQKSNTKGLYIKTYGCQANVYDSERMRDVLKPLGYAPVDTAEAADLVVLNTCQHPLDPDPVYHHRHVKLDVLPGDPPASNDPSLTIRPENLRAWENNQTYHLLRFP